MSQTSTSIHTPTMMCGCPACLAAMGFTHATGSGSVSPAPAKTIPTVLAPAAVSDLTLGSISVTTPIATVTSSTLSPAAPVAPTNNQTPQRSGPVATQTFKVFGGDQYNTGGWDQEFGASFNGSLQGLTGNSGTSAYLAFTASAGSRYWFSAGLGSGTTMSIVDSVGAAVTLNNTSTSSYKSFTALASGTYFVKLTSATNVSYNVYGGDTLSMPPNPSTATYQDSFYSILAGGGYYWKNLSSAAAITETSDGLSNARHSLTYSFATSDPAGDPDGGFTAMGTNEKAAVRAALAYISSLYDITFTEVAAGTGDIVYANNNQGNTSAGYAYYPSASGSNVYLNNQYYGEGSDYSAGTYAWEVLIHETGHALGLKHPGNYNAGGGGTSGPYLPSSTDLRTYTVMSYYDAANLTYYTVTGNQYGYSWQYNSLNPSTYQHYDFEALQYLYGARTGVHLGNVAFAVNPVMLKTIYADSGLNIIDISNQTLSSDVNLNAGTFSSIGKRTTTAELRADIPSWATAVPTPTYNGVNDLGIAAGSKFDEVKLGSGAADTVICNNDGDTIVCGNGSATITGGAGNDNLQIASNTGTISFTGGGGTDTVTVAGSFANYSVSYVSGSKTVTLINNSTGKVDTLVNIASIQFNDQLYLPGGATPVVTLTKPTVSEYFGHHVNVADLFTATDTGGTISSYTLIDKATAAGSGYFLVKGVNVGSTATISASDLGSTVFVAGANAVTESLTIEAFDSGTNSNSGVKTLYVATLAPVPPTVIPASPTGTVYYNRQIQVSSLFIATDVSGTIDHYRLSDSATAPGSGHFRVNGVDQAVGATVLISASDLASTVFIAGTNPVTETISITAIDTGNSTSALTTVGIPTVTPVPTVTLTQNTVTTTFNQAIALSSVFTASDLGDSITGYVFKDTTANGAGHFRVNGVDQAVGATVTISASNLASTYFIPGFAGTESITIQASDHYSVASAQTVTVTVPFLPPVTTALSAAVSAAHLQSFGFSDLFGTSDPQNLAIVSYDFYDTSSGNGAIFLNGVAQASGTDIIVAASALNTLRFVASGTDVLSARVNDGHNWSASYAKVTISGPVDTAPVTTATNSVAARPGDIVAASSLFTTTDPEGDVITQYQLLYNGAAGGKILVNGVAQGAGNVVTVNATDLSKVTIQAGTGTDSLYVKASDGFLLSGWTTISISGAILPPVVAANSTAVSAARLQAFGFSDLFTTTLPQGGSIVSYDFLDNTPGNGAILLNGVAQAAGTDIVVAASALSTLRFVASGTDALSARVWDGFSWSAYKNVTIAGPADQAPAITAATGLTSPRPGGAIAASSLFTAVDPDAGDSVVKYVFYDDGASGGQLTLNGVAQGVGAVVTVSAADLRNVGVIAGAGTDTLYVKAGDGFLLSGWKAISITGAILPPVVAANSTAVSATRLQAFGFSDLFTTTLPQGGSIVSYDFLDNTPGNGAILLNGVAQAAGTDIVVAASALSTLRFVASGTDALSARVWDGFSWSAYKNVTIAGPADQAPAITAATGLTSPRPGGAIAASSLFTAVDPDAGDSVVKYVFYDDGASGGQLTLNGVAQGVGAVVTVSAADLRNVGVIAGAGTDTLYVKAGDGFLLSGWKAISITGQNIAPVTTAISATVSPIAGTTFHFTDLFSTSDLQGAGTATRYEFYDETAAGGKTYIGTALQSVGTDVIVTGANLSSLSYVANGNDTLYARFYDGYAWSAFAHVTLNGPAASPLPSLPVFSASVSAPLAAAVSGASLSSLDPNKHGFGFAAAS
jgi:hypothetical protein